MLSKKQRQARCPHHTTVERTKGPHLGTYCQACDKWLGWIKQHNAADLTGLQAAFLTLAEADRWDFLAWAEAEMEHS